MIEFGPCDGEGTREIHLISELTPSTPDDLIQWIIDGQPFGPVQAPGLYVGRVQGDGEYHSIELHIVAPEDAIGDAEQVRFPACEDEVAANIRRIDFGDCDDEGVRPLRLIPQIVPQEAEGVVVQWFVDGQPVGAAGAPDTVIGSIAGDGEVHEVELRVISPEGATGDTQSIEVPECDREVVGRITSVDYGECDDEGVRPLRLIPQIVPQDAEGVVVQWFVDGQPVGTAGAPNTIIGSIAGDGEVHEVELRVVSPEGAEGDSETIKIPECEQPDVDSTKLVVDIDGSGEFTIRNPGPYNDPRLPEEARATPTTTHREVEEGVHEAIRITSPLPPANRLSSDDDGG